jgi:hypothetical protein
MLFSQYPKTKNLVSGLLLGISCLSFTHINKIGDPRPASSKKININSETHFNFLYDSLQLDTLDLSRPAFAAAIKGYRRLAEAGQIENQDVLSIVDFSLPSDKKRLFVIDLTQGRLLYNTYVSHGRNSGKAMATRFSNRPHSYMSSLGLYVTGDTYMGKNGYSLRLDGREKGINDRALSRGIVMHPADYVNQDLARSQGWIGRSEGCPAIPEEIHHELIETIKNGTCLYLYSPVATDSHKHRHRGKHRHSGRHLA